VNLLHRPGALPTCRLPSRAAERLPESVALALPKAGDVVAGKYQIEKVVGEGGMGIVYAAHHLVLDQRVALKLLLIDSLRGDETVERFVREAQAAARLRSEHVVRVTDAGALDSGMPFLVMEYLQGCDLAELVALEGPLASADAADYMLQALSALAQAHMAGIVHRDLKPANLYLAIRDDGSNILKILDFGISKQESAKAQWKELTGQAVLGTPAYMSPEQLRSSKSVDARADIWSLGVVMYELLCGQLPFDGEGPGEIFAAILEKTPEPMRSHRYDLSPIWEDVVTRCLSRDPAQRFQDVGELARAITPLGSGRWAHALGLIDQALARSPRSLPKADSALVQAVAAVVTSLPAPRFSAPATARQAGRMATFVTDETMFAEVKPQAERKGRRRPVGWLAAMAGVFVLVALVIGAGHGASDGSARGPAGRARMPLASPPPAALPTPAATAPAPSASAADALADDTASLASNAIPSSAPNPVPKPARVSAGARRAPSSTAKTVSPEARPKFLKSWR
jgi:serine/threonine protein kinase